MNEARSHPMARRTADIAPFRVMELLARAQQLAAEGRSIVHMEIGEPDFATPEPVLAAAQEALSKGRTHYTPATGLPVLREAIARYYDEHYGVSVSPDRVVVTPGASGALQLVMAVLVNPGDRVLMADPGYPCNRHFVRVMEGRGVGVPTGPDERYQLTARAVADHWQEGTAAVMLASPSNPTGTVLAASQAREIIDEVRARGGAVIMDEIYQGLVYEAPSETALALSDEVFVVNSFSKYFSMTGWRLGWVIAPEAYVPELTKLAQNLFLAPPTPSQYAALAAFEPRTLEILEQRRQIFRARRDFLLPALRELGFRIPVTPQGAFYLYADSAALADDSMRLAHDLLEHAGVAITPGLDFGEHRARQSVRFAYTNALDNLERGVERLRAFLAA